MTTRGWVCVLVALTLALAATWLWRGGSSPTEAVTPSAPAPAAESGATEPDSRAANSLASGAESRTGITASSSESTAPAAPTNDDAARGAREHLVEVVWSDGRPAPDAAVFVRALDADELAGRQVAATDVAGAARFEATSPRVVVWASHDEFASLPREARAGSRTRLVLAGLVSAEGELRPNPDIPGVKMRVTCFALDGARRVKLAQRLTTIDEPWRMDGLPLPDTQQFLFRFESDKTMPIEARRRAEKPGDVLRVDMELLAGYVRPVRVEDTEGKPVADARVVALYVNVISQPVTFEGVTDADGDCLLAGVPPREGELYASKKGYATTYYSRAIHALLPEDQVWTITLPRAAPIRGRCLTAAGDPVEDFDLLWFPPTSSRAHRREFRSARDGAFELDEIAVGNVTLIAESDELGQSAPLALELAPSGAQDVELRLRAAAVVTGIVLNAIDEAPIAGALIQPWSASATRNFSPRGAVVVADGQGRFRCERFNAGINRFEVSAPGYAPRLTGAFAEVGRDVDAGVIRLARAQPLEVELIHGPDVIPTESYATGEDLSGSRVLPPVAFDAQGRLRFPDVAPGPWRIKLMLYNGYAGEYEVVLTPGEEWKLRVDASQLRPWTLELRQADGALLPGGAVLLTWNDHEARGHVSAGLDASFNGRITLQVPRVAAAFLRVLDSNGRCALERHVGAAEFESDPYVVKLGDGAAEYRVVDGAGRPIPGVSISSLNSGDTYRQWTTSRTDADGRAQLPHARDVLLKHETAGMAVRFALSESDRVAGVYELELEAAGALDVVVRDGAFVVSGAEVQLGQREHTFTSPITDANGVARSLPLVAARWDARLEAPGYWPARASIDFARGSPPLRLEVRRLSDVLLELRSASGARVAGVTLELTSDEFGERVSDWLAAGRIASSTGAMSVDVEGRVRLTGLPHGKYRWLVTSAGEGVAGGEVLLEPRAVAQVEVRVP